MELVSFVAIMSTLASLTQASIDFIPKTEKCDVIGMKFNTLKRRFEGPMKDKCGMCVCNKDGYGGYCKSQCSTSFITVEYQVKLLAKGCYMAKEGELSGYPSCCKNTVICRRGPNRDHFNIHRYREARKSMPHFHKLIQLIRMKKMRQRRLRYRQRQHRVRVYKPRRFRFRPLPQLPKRLTPHQTRRLNARKLKVPTQRQPERQPKPQPKVFNNLPEMNMRPAHAHNHINAIPIFNQIQQYRRRYSRRRYYN